MVTLEDLRVSPWNKLVENLAEGDLMRLLGDYGIRVYDTSIRRKGCRHGDNYKFDIIAHTGRRS